MSQPIDALSTLARHAAQDAHMTIALYDDINASHAATGYVGRTDLDDFHIFRVADTYPTTQRVMPPYRYDFYQVVLFENADDATLEINTEVLPDLSDKLVVASPDHVLTWVRGVAQQGYILFFKPDFLAHYPRPVRDEFPFFRLNELNHVQLNAADKASLDGQHARLLQLFESDHPYRVQMLQALLLALLFDCKRIYDGQEQTVQQRSQRGALVYRFQRFVDQHHLVHKKVADYAELLAVSPDYLRQVVRAQTGKTPSALIAERLVLAAKQLLLYTDLSVGEVAVYLGYTEPTHFGRFFRKQTGSSPAAWRAANR